MKFILVGGSRWPELAGVSQSQLPYCTRDIPNCIHLLQLTEGMQCSELGTVVPRLDRQVVSRQH